MGFPLPELGEIYIGKKVSIALDRINQSRPEKRKEVTIVGPDPMDRGQKYIFIHPPIPNLSPPNVLVDINMRTGEHVYILDPDLQTPLRCTRASVVSKYKPIFTYPDSSQDDGPELLELVPA